jgi:hypothetical protein
MLLQTATRRARGWRTGHERVAAAADRLRSFRWRAVSPARPADAVHGTATHGVPTGRRVIVMGLGWILRRLAGDSRRAGLFDYLARRDDNKTRVKLENDRRGAARDLVDRLPSGAVYREKTADGWMEIQTPDAAGPPSLFVLPMDQCDRPAGHVGPSAEPPQQTLALGHEGGQDAANLGRDGR